MCPSFGLSAPLPCLLLVLYVWFSVDVHVGICVDGVCVCVLCARVHACALVYMAEQGTTSGTVTQYCQRSLRQSPSLAC